MIKHKLIHLLKPLSSDEWTSLRKWMLMHTRQESSAYTLFDILRKKTRSIHTNEHVYQIHSQYFSHLESKAFSNLMSKITVWVEDWIVYMDLHNDHYRRGIALVRHYNDHGLFKEATHIASQLQKKINQKESASIEKYQYLFDLYMAQYYSDNPIKYQKGVDMLSELVTVTQSLFSSYLSVINIEMTNFGRLKAHDYGSHQDTIESILQCIPPHQLSPLLEHLHKVVRDRDLESYTYLKDRLYHDEIESESFLHVITTLYLVAASMNLWSKGSITDQSEAVDIYQYALEKGVMMSSGKIPKVRWHNFISAWCQLFTKDKVHHLIDQWHTSVVSEDTYSTKMLSYAQIAFHFGDYDRIRDYIYDMNFVVSEDKMRSQSLILISLFKDRHENQNLFYDVAENFKRQLQRNKKHIGTTGYNYYYNFTKTLVHLARSEYKKYVKSIDKSKQIIYRTWVTEEAKKMGVSLS